MTMAVYAWDFEDVDATAGPVNVLSLSFEFADHNVNGIGTPVAPEGGTAGHVDVYDRDESIFAGHVAPPNDAQNVLMLTGPLDENNLPVAAPFDYIFQLATPCASFSMTRPALLALNGGFIHPSWKMLAYDGPNLVADTGEDPHKVENDVDKQTFTVVAPEGHQITSVRFRVASDGASVPGFVMDSFSMETA